MYKTEGIFLLSLVLTTLAENSSNDIFYYKLNETLVVYPPVTKVGSLEKYELLQWRDQSEIAYYDFSLRLLKKYMYPQPTKFQSIKTIDPHVRSVYYRREDGMCVYEPYIWTTVWYENCELAVLELEFDRSAGQACTATKCSLKFSTKISTSEKATSSWKIGGKLSQSLKLKAPGDLESVTTLEISDEYGSSYENALSYENLVEASVELTEGFLGVPTVLVAGAKCNVSVMALDYKRLLTWSDMGDYVWYVRKKLEPCNDISQPKPMYFNVLPDPYENLQVITPLHDARGRNVKLKYIQVHQIENNGLE